MPVRMAKTLISPNAGKDVKQQKLSFIAGGNIISYSNFQRHFNNVLYAKNKIRFMTQSVI